MFKKKIALEGLSHLDGCTLLSASTYRLHQVFYFWTSFGETVAASEERLTRSASTTLSLTTKTRAVRTSAATGPDTGLRFHQKSCRKWRQEDKDPPPRLLEPLHPGSFFETLQLRCPLSQRSSYSIRRQRAAAAAFLLPGKLPLIYACLSPHAVSIYTHVHLEY